MELALPATGDGTPEVKWKVPLDAKGCLRLARNDRAIFATQVDGGIVEFDAATHEPVHRYQIGSPQVAHIAVRGDRLEAHLIEEIPDLPHRHRRSAAEGAGPRRLHAQSRRPLRRRSRARPDHDLRTRDRANENVDCSSCRVIGFDGDNVITLEHQKSLAATCPTASSTALLYQFGQEVDEARYFPGRNVVIGMRELRPETIVRLGEQPKGILVRPAKRKRR